MSANLAVVGALTRRALNEILRVPGAAIPGVLAPTIFFIGLSAVFGEATSLRGFEADSFREYILPVSMLQGAAFTGAATGVNLARDIEQGWFDRLLVCPAPRLALLLGIVGSASLRALLPMSFLLVVAFALGLDWPGVTTLLLSVVLVMALAGAVAFYAVTIALRFKTQAAAPLMQTAGFIGVLFTTAYAPKPLLSDWLEVVATANPVTLILEGVRQGYVADPTWADTWPALVAAAGLAAALGALAVRGMRRVGV